MLQVETGWGSSFCSLAVPLYTIYTVHKKWFSQFGVEEPDWSAQSSDLIQHLWDELDR